MNEHNTFGRLPAFLATSARHKHPPGVIRRDRRAVCVEQNYGQHGTFHPVDKRGGTDADTVGNTTGMSMTVNFGKPSAIGRISEPPTVVGLIIDGLTVSATNWRTRQDFDKPIMADASNAVGFAITTIDCASAKSACG